MEGYWKGHGKRNTPSELSGSTRLFQIQRWVDAQLVEAVPLSPPWWLDQRKNTWRYHSPRSACSPGTWSSNCSTSTTTTTLHDTLHHIWPALYHVLFVWTYMINSDSNCNFDILIVITTNFIKCSTNSLYHLIHSHHFSVWGLHVVAQNLEAFNDRIMSDLAGWQVVLTKLASSCPLTSRTEW